MNYYIDQESKDKLDDYDRLSSEYTKLHQDYRRMRMVLVKAEKHHQGAHSKIGIIIRDVLKNH